MRYMERWWADVRRMNDRRLYYLAGLLVVCGGCTLGSASPGVAVASIGAGYVLMVARPR